MDENGVTWPHPATTGNRKWSLQMDGCVPSWNSIPMEEEKNRFGRGGARSLSHIGMQTLHTNPFLVSDFYFHFFGRHSKKCQFCFPWLEWELSCLWSQPCVLEMSCENGTKDEMRVCFISGPQRNKRTKMGLNAPSFIVKIAINDKTLKKRKPQTSHFPEDNAVPYI